MEGELELLRGMHIITCTFDRFAWALVTSLQPCLTRYLIMKCMASCSRPFLPYVQLACLACAVDGDHTMLC